MLINVPQYIDVEDKIVGPLTAKQLGWMVALGVILMILWNMTPKPVFFIVGLPLVILFVALAFYKPYGQPLGSFIIFGVMYFFRPKVYFWKRSQTADVKDSQKNQKEEAQLPDKRISSESLRDLAQLLDSEGTQYSKGIEEILNKAPVKK
jgi:membrane protein implicated in regulation of membrane protease activity